MYGLPSDTDLSFFDHATLIQVCVGENEVILHLDPGISVMVASLARIHLPNEASLAADDSREVGRMLLPLLGAEVVEATAVEPGTLRLAWSTGQVLEIEDSWEDYESYTITVKDTTIVV